MQDTEPEGMNKKMECKAQIEDESAAIRFSFIPSEQVAAKFGYIPHPHHFNAFSLEVKG